MKQPEIDFFNISPYIRFIHIDDFESGYAIPYRLLYDYELVFMLDGELHVKTDTDQYTLKAGDLHIMPPKRRHKRSGEKVKLYSVHFDMTYSGEEYDFSALEIYSKACDDHLEAMEVDEHLFKRPVYSLRNIVLPEKLTTVNPSQYIEVLGKAHSMYMKKPYGYELDMKICMLELLRLVILDTHAVHVKNNLSDNEQRIIHIIDYLNNNFNQKISFEEIAEENGFTYAYMRKIFKRISGKYPAEYLAQLRIETAIDYMRTYQYTIAEVAQLVGYENKYYFSRIFKKKKGCPPSEFNGLRLKNK